jgi:hypothetical protein
MTAVTGAESKLFVCDFWLLECAKAHENLIINYET